MFLKVSIHKFLQVFEMLRFILKCFKDFPSSNFPSPKPHHFRIKKNIIICLTTQILNVPLFLTLHSLNCNQYFSQILITKSFNLNIL